MGFLLTVDFCTLEIDVNNLYFVRNYTQEYSAYLFMITYMSVTVRLNQYIDYLVVIDRHELLLLHNYINYLLRIKNTIYAEIWHYIKVRG